MSTSSNMCLGRQALRVTRNSEYVGTAVDDETVEILGLSGVSPDCSGRAGLIASPKAFNDIGTFFNEDSVLVNTSAMRAKF